jgi:hypothetical protein
MTTKTIYVQTRNPKTGRYVLIDKTHGVIIGHHPKKETPYKNIEVMDRRVN